MIPAEGDAEAVDGDIFLSPRSRPITYENKKVLPIHSFGSDPTKANPIVYVIVLGCEGLDRVVPLEFLLLDCSKMTLVPGAAQSGLVSALGFTVSCTVSSATALVGKPTDLRALLLSVVR